MSYSYLSIPHTTFPLLFSVFPAQLYDMCHVLVFAMRMHGIHLNLLRRLVTRTRSCRYRERQLCPSKIVQILCYAKRTCDEEKSKLTGRVHRYAIFCLLGSQNMSRIITAYFDYIICRTSFKKLFRPKLKHYKRNIRILR